MDRKGIVGISIAVVTLIVWNWYYTTHYQPPKRMVRPATAVTSPIVGAASPALAQGSATPLPPPTGEPFEETLQTAPGVSTEFSFTNRGGGIARATLLNHMAENGEKVKLNEFGSIPIGAITEKPGEDLDTPYVVTVAHQTVTCVATGPNQIEVAKTFTLPAGTNIKDEYLTRLEVAFTNRGTGSYQSPGYYVYTGSAAPIHHRDLPTFTGFDWYRNGKAKFVDVNWFEASRIPLIGIERRAAQSSYNETADNITWAGVKNQYFTTIVNAENATAKTVWARRFPVPNQTDRRLGVEGALGMPGFTLAPGQTYKQQFGIYAGPKEFQRLKSLGHGEGEIMNFGMFKIVSEFLLSSMNWLNAKLGNYAAAIFVLTICIKSALWPLQNKATSSMKRMQALQPKMTELREKYKDDPTRMNQELMKLYKDYGINPFGGCLPMFFQIPIFFGFYSMLGSAIELRNSKFLWVQDLSQPDTVFHLGGIPVNILPLCMAVTMFWQMAISPKSGDAVQQRIFMFVPLIFVVFCYNYASALALYFTVQNLFSIVQLYLTRNKSAPVLVKVTGPSKGRGRGKS